MNSKFVEFESVNLERAKDIAKRFPMNCNKVTRAEIILTNKCQLNCVYCQKKLDCNTEEEKIEHSILLQNLMQWLDNGCKFIHFTGGEATLCEHLPEYVKMAREKGAEVTLSTNAVNNIEVYRQLIEAGVTCFHISLDTNNADIFDAQVGKRGAFERVIGTINFITYMRDIEGYKIKLVTQTSHTIWCAEP